MIPQPSGRPWVYKQAVDMRKSFGGLALLVQGQLLTQAGDVFFFLNKNRDKVKGLYWHENGFCVFYKCLEKEHFKPPQTSDLLYDLTPSQVRFLLEGLDLTRIPERRKTPSLFRYSIFLYS